MGRIPAAVVGATGNIGQRLVGLLQDHPYFQLEVLGASSRNSGRTLGELWRQDDMALRDDMASATLSPIDAGALARKGVAVAFSALPSEVAKGVEAQMADLGIRVFSDASSHRMDPDVPTLVPEVNAEHLDLVKAQGSRFAGGGFIVTNPNCSIAGLTLPLKALQGRYTFTQVLVSTYQAVSGAGYPGVPSLDILGNAIPYIDGEEEKMKAEAKKILGTLKGDRIADAALEVEANCVRVPVRDGHLEAVAVVMPEEVDAAEAAATMASFRGVPQRKRLPTAPEAPIIVRREPNRPQPLMDAMAGSPPRARGMAVTVGRVRATGRLLKFFVLSHNTLRGGAGGSVLSAELAHALGYLR